MHRSIIFALYATFVLQPKQQNMPVLSDFPADYYTMINNDIPNNIDGIANYVDAFLQADSCFPQLADLLKINNQGLLIIDLIILFFCFDNQSIYFDSFRHFNIRSSRY